MLSKTLKMNLKIILPLILSSAMSCFAQNTESISVNAHFMVFSDPHYYDASLGIEGQAFQNYLDHDRKLLKESKELLLEAIQIITDSDAPFVLIPGDLTKDGSMVSHKEFAKLIAELEKKGKQVYIVPGNHDISNSDSKSYQGDEAIVVKNLDASGFRSNYKQFGFDEAIYADSNSLSYVVEPSEGLWVLGLDACKYRDNIPGTHSITDGAFSIKTLEWIDEIAKKASIKNKKMIAFMHHGIIEHYKKQDKFYGEYIVDDSKNISKKFAALGINVVFTGHYHAQDITIHKWKNGDFICDVETGSLVTYPCPVREVKISQNTMSVSSHFIEKTEQHPNDFVDFSKEYVHNGISGIAEKTLISYKLNPEDAAKLSGQIADAFIAHYQGDEVPKEKYFDMKGIGLMGRIVILVKRKLIVGLYNDLPPGDNEVTIDLNTGMELLPTR